MAASPSPQLNSLIKRFEFFFKVQLWEKPASGIRGFLYSTLQRTYLTIKFFIEEKLHYRASALSFELLLSIVPILAIIFAIAKGFGLQVFLEAKIREIFASQPEMIATLLDFTERYLSRVQGGVFLGIGLIMLLYTLFSLTQSVELAFNDVWHIKEDRSLGRKIVDYIAVFFILPIFLVISSGLSIFLTSFINSLPDIYLLNTTLRSLLELLPYLLMIICCTSLYIYIPNTQVKLRSALLAGSISGIVIQLLIFLYIHSQVYLSSYNAIYGSFAALPLLMLWSRFIWLTLLAGCTLSYVDQHINLFNKGIDNQSVSRRVLDFMYLRVLYHISSRISQRRPSPSIEELANVLDLPFGLVRKLLLQLEKTNIIEAAQPKNKIGCRYYLMVPPDMLTPSYVLEALSKLDDDTLSITIPPNYFAFYNAHKGSAFGQTKLIELDELK